LRPIAGDFAFLLFSAGIIGTGLLAVPVLAGSAAYGIAEAFRWRNGLGLDLAKARGFYGIIILATALGIGINFTPIDPIKALFWSAVINGVVAVPVMIIMMLMARKKEIMGAFVVKRRVLVLGWAATAVMTVMVAAMFATWGR
jgi:Mn2+/Fe2+ NRAMP family transporter